MKSLRSSWRFLLATVAALGFGHFVAGLPSANGAIVTAGTLFVDLDARDASAATGTWTNFGSAGNFTRFGTPTVANVGTLLNPAVTYNGTTDYHRGANAPAGLTGAGAAGTRTIEVWAFNPSIPGEETLVSLSKRGGGGGTNVSFNYGTDARFGAVGHWAGADIGWNGAPAAGTWNHLTYTFDGTTTNVYANGVLKNTENSTTANGGVPLDAHDSVNMLIAAQMQGDGTTVEPGLRGSLSIGNVRVHDGVLSAADVLNNFKEDAFRYGNAAVGVLPKHRYSFDGTGGNGAVLTDSMGGAHGVLRAGDASALNGSGQMNLIGGSSATAGYGDLPNNIVSVLTNATFEAWVTLDANSNWNRIFDFGDSTVGEVFAPGGVFNGNGAGGDGYLFMTPGSGAGSGFARVGLYEPGPGEIFADGTFRLGTGIEQHVAVVFDDTNDLMSMYVNGSLVGTVNVAGRSLNQILDVNNWLGRSNFSGDPNFDGLFNEFRIYNSALSGSQIMGNFLSGPNQLNAVVPEPTSIAVWSVLLAGIGGAMLRLRKRRS